MNKKELKRLRRRDKLTNKIENLLHHKNPMKWDIIHIISRMIKHLPDKNLKELIKTAKVANKEFMEVHNKRKK